MACSIGLRVMMVSTYAVLSGITAMLWLAIVDHAGLHGWQIILGYLPLFVFWPIVQSIGAWQGRCSLRSFRQEYSRMSTAERSAFWAQCGAAV